MKILKECAECLKNQTMFNKLIKQIEKKNIWQPECKYICISRKDLKEIFGDKLK